MNNYSVLLGNTYFNNGYFNPGVDASNNLDDHNMSLKIILRNKGEMNTTINREINANGSVRFYGGNEWINFIQDNFHLNEEIHFEVINPNTIKIL